MGPMLCSRTGVGRPPEGAAGRRRTGDPEMPRAALAIHDFVHGQPPATAPIAKDTAPRDLVPSVAIDEALERWLLRITSKGVMHTTARKALSPLASTRAPLSPLLAARGARRADGLRRSPDARGPGREVSRSLGSSRMLGTSGGLGAAGSASLRLTDMRGMRDITTLGPLTDLQPPEERPQSAPEEDVTAEEPLRPWWALNSTAPVDVQTPKASDHEASPCPASTVILEAYLGLDSSRVRCERCVAA